MTYSVPGNVRLARHVGDLDDDGHDTLGGGGAGGTGAAGPPGPPGADGEPGPPGVPGRDAVGAQFGIQVVIGDGATAMATGSKGYVEVPFTCLLIANRLAADVSGSVVVDIKKATYSGLFTTTSICSATKPTLSSARKSEDTSLTSWTTTISAGDWLEFNVDSVTTIKRVTLSLTVQRA